MTERLVGSDVVDGVGIVSFNRPARHNAIDDAMGEAWADAVTASLSDPAVRCVLLRGEGPSFSSGRDTAQLGRRVAGEHDYDFVRRHQRLREATLDATKPIVAAVRGYALGGGFEIALSADMRIAATDAQLGFPEIRYGLVPDTGGTQLLTALVGPARAKWLVISGARIGADEAHRWGVVDWVVEPDHLDVRALDLCRQLAAAPPTAAAMAKQLVDHAWRETVRSGMRAELLAQTALFAGEEHRQAKAAAIAAAGHGRAAQER
ncbi:MAG: enoyl-CoA hydratase [Acidimicrobiia bacterium]